MQTILCINCHTSCCNLLCSGILCASGMRRGRRWRCGPPQPHFLENQNLRHPSTAPPPAPPPFSSAPCCPGTAPYRTGPMPPGDHPVATSPGPHFLRRRPAWAIAPWACGRGREEEGRQADIALRPLPPLCRRAWQVAVAYTPQSAPPLTAGSPAAPPVRAAFHNGTLIPNLGSPDPK
jgi:hypothetical protein